MWINGTPIRPHHPVPENSAVEIVLLYHKRRPTVNTVKHMRFLCQNRCLHLNSPTIRVITQRRRHLYLLRAYQGWADKIVV